MTKPQLLKLKKDELLAMAAELGADAKQKDTKAIIVDKIKAAQKAAKSCDSEVKPEACETTKEESCCSNGSCEEKSGLFNWWLKNCPGPRLVRFLLGK